MFTAPSLHEMMASLTVLLEGEQCFRYNGTWKLDLLDLTDLSSFGTDAGKAAILDPQTLYFAKLENIHQ